MRESCRLEYIDELTIDRDDIVATRQSRADRLEPLVDRALR